MKGFIAFWWNSHSCDSFRRTTCCRFQDDGSFDRCWRWWLSYFVCNPLTDWPRVVFDRGATAAALKEAFRRSGGAKP